MREDLLKKLETEYAAIRNENERTESARAAEVMRQCPGIAHLKEQRQQLLRDSLTKTGTGKSALYSGAELKERVEEINGKIRTELKEAGFPEDYLAPVFRCKKCRDTGYMGELIKEPCSCLKEAYHRLLSQTAGSAGGNRETFESFNAGIIPDDRIDGQPYSQRDISCKARSHCEKWADRYPQNSYHTLVLSGESGLGKTFLMHAMAQRLTDRGYSVLMISAFQFLQTARKSMFENDRGLEDLIEVPALMIDDLGSEPLMKNITVEALFAIINERQNRGLSTVISTNLDMEEVRERYTERICSRITDPRTSLVIALKGKDLRKVNHCIV